ncbi:MAG TPA: UDP-glucose/GDP-mannose dehydrogenase family protein [Rhabdochlamydiaceae bacterium]|nr:UDP-glucose/GDP-mannose dehydrogenase family protein [Rhabdochlamydiaceae bacterium]
MKSISILFLILLLQAGELFSIEHDESFLDRKTHGITVIGTGYVGLTLGACLAEFGNHVICCDIDQDKIDLLNQGHIPIFEIGLKELVDKNVQENRLLFSSDVKQSIRKNEIIFIAVGTPSNENGEANLGAFHAVAKTIGKNINGQKVIFVKSTVPIGSVKKFADLIRQNCDDQFDFDLAYTPEFLREGTSVQDFCDPERVVIGSESKRANQILVEILWPLYSKKVPFLFTSIESAEMIKYAANSFLAVKIAFINEIANLCDQVGADVFEVKSGLALDSRIGSKCLNPGPGYGGYCLPKDTIALVHDAQKLGVDLKIVQAAIEANKLQPQIILQKLYKLLDSEVENKTIAILGLSFKENTDDVRCSPSLKIIEELLKNGAYVKAYDPIAMQHVKKIYPQIEYCDSSYDAAEESDAIMLLTGWKEFENIDLVKLRDSMKRPLFVDGRNLISTETLKNLGFKYENVGRSHVEKME